MPPRRAIVAVPVKNEAARIGACVTSIARQRETAPDAIVLLINNTDDATAAIVRGLAPSLRLPIHAIERTLPPESASAGAARRMALEIAASMLGRGGDVLLTTDADGCVPADWVARNLHHIGNGAEAVAGRVALDPVDAAQIPAALHADDALEVAYADALDALEAALDPVPWDPWPRHAEHSGASIAVTLDAYRRAGGMPAAALAEDRRFFAALRRVDARIRHAPEIVVTVSGRTVGRAEGGMADTIRRRLTAPDPYLDDALEPAAVAIRRVRVRALLRDAREGGADRAASLAELAAVPPETVRDALSASYVGEGLALLEVASPVLQRRLVLARDVHRETALAEAARRDLDHSLSRWRERDGVRVEAAKP